MPNLDPKPQLTPFQTDLEDALKTLTTRGGDGNRLLISHGDYYMLVMGTRGTMGVEVEVVANRFLPGAAKLTPGRLAVVTQHGFSDTVARRANLQRRVDLGVGESATKLLDGVEDIFRRGFGCDNLSAVKLDLSLQDRDKTANPDLLRAMKRLARLRDHNARQQVYRALLVADLLLLVADDQTTPHKVEELGGCPVYAVFTDVVSLRLWQPLGFTHRRVVGHALFPQLAPLRIGSLLINPKGQIGGELYRNEVDGLAGAAARYRA